MEILKVLINIFFDQIKLVSGLMQINVLAALCIVVLTMYAFWKLLSTLLIISTQLM